jgi:hypothetical protein
MRKSWRIASANLFGNVTAAVAITVIEVALIVSLMIAGGPYDDCARTRHRSSLQ